MTTIFISKGGRRDDKFIDRLNIKQNVQDSLKNHYEEIN